MNAPDVPASFAPDDVELVRAMARGEEGAATRLYDQQAAAMYALALELAGVPAEAETVVLDAIVHAWRGASHFDARSGSVRGWLTAIIRARAAELAGARAPGQAPSSTVRAEGAVVPPAALRERVQARVAEEAGTQRAAQIADDVARQARLLAPDPLDELRARLNAQAAATAGGSHRVAARDTPATAGPAVARATPGSRAVRVTPPRTPAVAGPAVQRGGSKAAWFVAALSAAGLAVAVLFALDVRRRVAVVEGQMREKIAQVTRLERRLGEKEGTLATLLAGRGGVVLVTLQAATPTGPGIQLFWNVRDGKAVLNAYGLAQVDPGRAYVLWMIRDSVPAPVTRFTPDETGRALSVDVGMPTSTSGVTLFTVTEESAPGAPAPTTAPLLTGPVPSPEALKPVNPAASSASVR